MRLALALGMTVGELSERMSVEEFLEWATYDEEHGLPDWRQEVLSGMQMMHTVNISGKSVKEYKQLQEFMPFQPKGPEREVDVLETFKCQP